MNGVWPIFVAVAILAWALALLRRARLASEQVQARVDVLSTAIEQSPAVVGITDLDANLIYVNPSFEQASGYTRDELMGQNPRVLQSGVTSDSEYQHMWDVITQGGVWSGEICNKRKDGTLYWEWASITGVRDRDGKLQHYVKVAEDITSRRRAAAALAESEKRFRTIFDLAGAGMALVDTRGRWLQVNDRLCHMLGYSAEELVGRPFLDFTPEEDHHLETGWSGRLKDNEGASSSLEKRYLARDGSIVHAEVTATLVRDAGNQPEYFICLIQDITRSKQAEEEATRRQNQLAHMARINTLQQMAGELSHEIDQPLCAIMSASQAALRMLEKGRCEDLVDDVKQAITLVAQQSERAGKVVDSIRSFSRKQSGDRGPFAFGEVIEQVTNLLGAEFRSQGVTLLVESPEDRDVQLHGDPVLLTQVLINLCRNGADAMLEQEARLKVLTLSWHIAGGEIHCRVHNLGRPLAPDLAEKVFQPFFTTREEGLGLGLSLSRSIVESFSGRIWAEPGEEDGTTFHVVLPLPEEGEEEQEKRENQ